ADIELFVSPAVPEGPFTGGHGVTAAPEFYGVEDEQVERPRYTVDREEEKSPGDHVAQVAVVDRGIQFVNFPGDGKFAEATTQRRGQRRRHHQQHDKAFHGVLSSCPPPGCPPKAAPRGHFSFLPTVYS